MKKLIIITMSAFMMLFTTTVNAREANRIALNTGKSSIKESKMERRAIRAERSDEISNITMDAFNADFGNIRNVVWEKDGLFDKAIFSRNGKQYEAYYDNTSTLVGTVSPKTFADLPKKAQKNIKKHYKSFKIDRVIFYKDNEDNDYNMELYGVQFNSNDNYFVEMSKKKENVVLEVSPQGNVSFFRDMEHA